MAGILPLRRLMRPRGSTLQFKPRAVHSCGMDLCSSLAKLRHSDPRCHARHSSQSHHRRLHHILDVFSGHLVDVLHRRPAAIGVVQGKVRRSSTSSDIAPQGAPTNLMLANLPRVLETGPMKGMSTGRHLHLVPILLHQILLADHAHGWRVSTRLDNGSLFVQHHMPQHSTPVSFFNAFYS